MGSIKLVKDARFQICFAARCEREAEIFYLVHHSVVGIKHELVIAYCNKHMMEFKTPFVLGSTLLERLLSKEEVEIWKILNK